MGLKGAAAILSFLVLIINLHKPPSPMNLKMSNEGFDIVIPGEGPASPKKLQYLRDRVGRQLMNLNAIGRQNIRKLLGYRQPKARSEKSRNTTLSFFRGFGVVSFPGNRHTPGSKHPSNRKASKSA
jgi:hypothetical protein